MLLPDVNVLVYAHRAESPDHERYAEWLRALAGGLEPFALSELGANGFVRIVTNPKIWDEPTTIGDALQLVAEPSKPDIGVSMLGCSSSAGSLRDHNS